MSIPSIITRKVRNLGKCLILAETVLESLTQEYKVKTNKLYNIQQVTKSSLISLFI